MNRNWFVDAERGRFALKRLTDRDPAVVRRNLGLLDHLAAEGIPVAPAVATIAGDLICEIEGSAYYLCEWIDGTHPGAEMNLFQAGNMGAVIARIHNALSIPSLSLPAPQPVQVTASAHLRPDPAATTGPSGWTHGDCQDFNLIWTGDRVGAVIDWDRIRVGPYAMELVRAAVWQFCGPGAQIDLANVAAFLTGYREVRPIDPTVLANAARHRWWRMLTHCWQLGFHYDRNDPTCDDLFFNDHRLLTWWSANLDTVEAAFGA
ncbi:phosphotransferase [Glycomyces lechevalierae]